MTLLPLLAALLSAATVNPFAELMQPAVDSNTAFYQGAQYSYVFGPPPGYRLVLEEATFDGLSLAFVPEDQPFDSAEVMIGATIYALMGDDQTLAQVIEEDTLAIRAHYASAIEMWSVDSVLNGAQGLLPTVYVNGRTEFVPTVMVSYFDGGDEIVIIELIISDRYPRFRAEEAFDAALRQFKPLRRGDPARIEFGAEGEQ